MLFSEYVREKNDYIFSSLNRFLFSLPFWNSKTFFWLYRFYTGNYPQRMDLRKLHIIKDQIAHGFDTCFKGTVVHEKLRCMMVPNGI